MHAKHYNKIAKMLRTKREADPDSDCRIKLLNELTLEFAEWFKEDAPDTFEADRFIIASGFKAT
jgi:hypothetical protein